MLGSLVNLLMKEFDFEKIMKYFKKFTTPGNTVLHKSSAIAENAADFERGCARARVVSCALLPPTGPP